MTPFLAVPLLVLAVVLLMTLGASVLAFLHGWADGPSSHENDRHTGLPALAYGLGWRARRAQENGTRDAIAERHARDSAAFYRALDDAVKHERERRP